MRVLVSPTGRDSAFSVPWRATRCRLSRPLDAASGASRPSVAHRKEEEIPDAELERRTQMHAYRFTCRFIALQLIVSA